MQLSAFQWCLVHTSRALTPWKKMSLSRKLLSKKSQSTLQYYQPRCLNILANSFYHLQNIMATASKKFKLNKKDILNAIKNMLIFGVPLFIANIDAIQSYIVTIAGINPDLLSILLSTLVKLGQYYIADTEKA